MRPSLICTVWLCVSKIKPAGARVSCEVGLDGVIGTSTLTQNGIFTTDAQGEIKITNLAPGAYVLTEIKAPTGYVMDTASTNVVIGQGGDTQTVVVTNSKAGTLVIDKRDSLTGKPLEGVTFKVTTSTGEFVPAENGQISSNGLYFVHPYLTACGGGHAELCAGEGLAGGAVPFLDNDGPFRLVFEREGHASKSPPPRASSYPLKTDRSAATACTSLTRTARSPLTAW